jgi:hypothetical protein
MPVLETFEIKQRIKRLIDAHEVSAAARAVESFTNRLHSLNHRIHQLLSDDKNAVQAVLYTELEKVLMRFEELESLGPCSGPVSSRHIALESIRAYRVRFGKIDACLDHLPMVEKLATSAVLHRESEEVLKLFEDSKLLRRWVKNARQTRQRPHWN